MTRLFPVLVGHFFHRLFQNDFVTFEDQMKEKTISFLALVAVFSAHIANSVLMKYIFVEDTGISWVEKCYFTAFIMLLLAFITVFEWDVLFPDSRDFKNLMILPLRIRTVFAAKFTSLCLFVGIFALGANTISTLAFWFHLIRWQEGRGVLFYFYFILVHLICMFAASFFVFFLTVFIIGILMALFPERIFRALSLFIRTGLMIACVFTLIYIVSGSLTAQQPFMFLPELKTNSSILFYLFPPMWFTGLYESLLGSLDPQFGILAAIALLSLVLVAAGFFLSATLGYKKYNRLMETRKKENYGRIRWKRKAGRVFDVLFLRDSLQRAIFYFFGKTLKNSMVHKMRLVTFIAVGVGLELILLVSSARNINSLTTLNTTLLTIPMILILFLLVGMRSVVSIPSSLEANWIFRLTEENKMAPYLTGLRKGIVFYVLVPLFVPVFVFFSFLWEWKIGMLHCLYGLSLAVLLMEALFIRHHKIPFACSYLPGKARAHIFWLFYFVSFILYVSLVSRLELALLQKPSLFFLFGCTVLLLYIALKTYQHYSVYKKMALAYEEEPEPVMVTLRAYNS